MANADVGSISPEKSRAEGLLRIGRLVLAACLIGWVLIDAVPSAAQMIEAESRIVAVTVFADRATVVRQMKLDLPAGAHTVSLGPLPSDIEPESVMVRGSGTATILLYGARIVTRQLDVAQDPAVRTLEEEIRKLTRQQQQQFNTKRILDQEQKYLSSIQAASGEQIGKDLITKSPNASEAAALLAFLDDALLKNAEREQQADLALEDLSSRLDKLRRQLSELTQGRARQEALILVELDASSEGSFGLEISYRIPGATWSPSYEARAATASDEVELASSAIIRQQTGEDWNDVQLTLSTAKPAIVGSMPEPQPWFLKPLQPMPLNKAGLMDSRAMFAGAMKDEAAQAPQLPRSEEARAAVAAVEAQGPAVVFHLPKHETIPADWQPHKVSVASQKFKAGLAYQTAPRLIPYAFLRAKIKNTTEVFYLPGPVSVFLDGAFIATAGLEQVAPGEEFELYLGADERLKVERKQLREHVEVSLLPGLRGKTKSTDYELLTTLENFTGRRIAVTVFDQIPVSEREEIVVESVKYAPPEIEKDDQKPGVFRWTVDMGPNQKQELRLTYRVRHPVDMQIQ